MIGPEIHHDFTQLALGQRGADNGKLLQLAVELPKLSHRLWEVVGTHRVRRRSQLALHALPLALRVPETLGEVLAIVIEALEVVLAPFPFPGSWRIEAR